MAARPLGANTTDLSRRVAKYPSESFLPHTSSVPRIADSSSPVKAFSARCDWNSTIAATMSASAPNSPSSALTKTWG